MTTKFFLYTKKDGYSVQDITGCQIINPASYAGTVLLYPEESIDIHYNNAILEGSLIEWCKEFCSKDGIFLDIGAHTGTYSVCLSEHCHSVYAFEPQERTYYALCGSVVMSNRQNIRCLKLGLGSPYQIVNLGGRSPYQVIKSSILKVQNEDGGNSTIVDDIDPDKVIRTEEIEMTTLDSFFNGRKLDAPIQFIKIDVENNELDVLQGAVKTLESNGFPKIVFEGNSNPEKQRELIDYLENILKYRVVPISGYPHMFLAVH